MSIFLGGEFVSVIPVKKVRTLGMYDLAWLVIHDKIINRDLLQKEGRHFASLYCLIVL